MAYYGNNNYNRNNRGGNYNRGYYDNRGYDYDRSDSRMMDDRDDRPFEINQAVRHIATGTKLYVIKYGREQIECRKPDLGSEYFYRFELEPWTE